MLYQGSRLASAVVPIGQVGRLDSRYIGIDRNTVSSASSEFDPANAATTPVFVACFNDYIVRELKYKTQRRYYLLGGFPGFRWRYPENAMGDTSESLRCAVDLSQHRRPINSTLNYLN
jgi:hypothetical protein